MLKQDMTFYYYMKFISTHSKLSTTFTTNKDVDAYKFDVDRKKLKS